MGKCTKNIFRVSGQLRGFLGNFEKYFRQAVVYIKRCCIFVSLSYFNYYKKYNVMEKIISDINASEQNPIILYKGSLFAEVEAFVKDNNLQGKVNILRIEQEGAWSLTANHEWLEAATRGKSRLYVWAEPSQVTGVLKDELLKLYAAGIVYTPLFGNWQPKTSFFLTYVELVEGAMVTKMVMDGGGFGPKQFPTYESAQGYMLFLGADKWFQVQKFSRF